MVKLVASFANSGALLSNGKYFDWGYNGAGQLGDGDHRQGIGRPGPGALAAPGHVRVAQGGSIWNNGQTLVKLSDGSLWGPGQQPGLPARPRGAGRQVAAGPLLRPRPGCRYRSLATGSATSYAVSSTGNVYAWGVSYEGQLGDGFLNTTP